MMDFWKSIKCLGFRDGVLRRLEAKKTTILDQYGFCRRLSLRHDIETNSGIWFAPPR
jgi:hypothetical protein